MYRKILVGCDGTEHEADAIALAQQLCDPQGGRLILANVFPLVGWFQSPGVVPPGPVLASDYSDWLAVQADESLGRAAMNLSAATASERRTIASPSPAAGLNDLAEELATDLIVLGGTHRGLAGDLAGRETVQRLLHGAPCAVAVATTGQHARFGDSPTIAVAYDASPEARAALDVAYRLAAETSAAVALYAVVQPIVYAAGFAGGAVVDLDAGLHDAAVAELEEAAARAPDGVHVERQVLTGHPAEVLLATASEADLLVSGSRGYGPLHRALVGSTSGALLKNGRVPVLVTPRSAVHRTREAPIAAAATG